METCETCEYWERYDNPKGFKWGNCTLIAKCDAPTAEVEFDGSDEFMEWISGNTMLFSTRENFGCVEYERKERK